MKRTTLLVFVPYPEGYRYVRTVRWDSGLIADLNLLEALNRTTPGAVTFTRQEADLIMPNAGWLEKEL